MAVNDTVNIFQHTNNKTTYVCFQGKLILREEYKPKVTKMNGNTMSQVPDFNLGKYKYCKSYISFYLTSFQ